MINMFIRLIFFHLLIFTVMCVSFAAKACTRDGKPNIVFVMADDMGYGDIGCYGQQKILTPNIDRIAEEGMRFTQCYAGSPVCAPSRSVLMTGQHSGHTTVRGNFGVGGVVGLCGNHGRIPLRDVDVTVAEVLKKAGYTTCITGKWGLGEPNTSGVPRQQGFDRWFGYLNQRRAHSYYPSYLWLGEHRFDLPGNSEDRKQQYSHDLFTGYALNFIRSHQDKPFFLYLPLTIPHSNFEVPDLGPYDRKDWPQKAKKYAAMITRMDGDIGRIVALLDELHIDDNTIFFFCSDNGAANRHEGLFDSSGPLRGMKRDLYEGGLRTPMIVRWPGHVPAKSTSDLVWYFADVLPTLADIADVKAPAHCDGVSVLQTLLGEPQDISDRFLYWEFFENGFQQAARWGDWKCLRLEQDKPLELYDLANDVGETTDVAYLYSGIVQRFESYLATARVESTDFPKGRIETQ